MKILSENGSFDCSNTMYPSEIVTFSGKFQTPAHWQRSTVFGYSLSRGSYKYNDQTFAILENSFFSIPIFTSIPSISFETTGQLTLFVRHGFIGQTIFLGLAEKSGRLTYVDGCSDSLLIFPPRLGDASLNLLYLPENISQTEHTHPSIRFGLIAEGSGVAETKEAEHPLKKGDIFLIEAHELHRFKTNNSFLRVIAFHPDGDFGPTDNNHSMLNRSYFRKSSLGK